MKGFIKLAIAGFISFSSSAFANDVVVDGKGKIDIGAIEISDGVAKVTFKNLREFRGLGDPNLDCKENKLIVIDDRKHIENNYNGLNSELRSIKMVDRIWTIANLAYLEEVSVDVEIHAKDSKSCHLIGIKMSDYLD